MEERSLALRKHSEWKGKIGTQLKAVCEDKEDLAVVYTPGVAEPCLEIEKDEDLQYEYTGKGNTVAVITDGSAVLGLGNIGPSASMPVMEGKAALFKRFADINAVPICLDTQDTEELIRTIYLMSKSFGGINLEDISAPRCFEIEQRLIEMCDIPIFHDDQHGTAIIAGAAMLNAAKVTGRKRGELKIVINGAGAAGISVAKMMLSLGLGEVILCDIHGIINEGDPNNNPAQEAMAKVTNRNHMTGTLADAMKGADAFFGVSRPNLVSQDMVRSMAKDPIVFAMANPTPEILPDDALAAGAAVAGTGRSDYPNQVNNVLIFPGFFKGLLSVGARKVTNEMKVAAAEALASVIDDNDLRTDYVLPGVFDERVPETVANAVAKVAIESGLARIEK